MPTVRTNDIETYYEMRGDGPPVVLVHAAIVDLTQVRPQFDALAAEHTVVAYDVRGHGRTGGSDVTPYSMALFAEDLRALLEALDLENPVLVGFSNGGAIAVAYADAYPDDVAGLVLCDSFGPALLGWADWVQAKVVLPATIYPTTLVGYQRVERWLKRLNELFNPGSTGEYERIEAIREEGPLMCTTEFAKVIRAIGTFFGSELDVGSISAPTLVLHGEHVPGFLERQARWLAGTIPAAELEIVPGGGHASNLDNPEFVNGALCEFLRAVWPESRGLEDDAGETPR